MSESSWKPKAQNTTSAPNYVIEEIRRALLKHELNPGDRLPSETELTNSFGVSRGSIRQAMKSLEMLGVLSIRPGDGTYVNTSISDQSFNPLAFSLLISHITPKQMVDARYALERDILELILENDDGVEDLIEALENNVEYHRILLRQHCPVENLVENDQKFHLLMSKACGNMLFEIIYDYIMDTFEDYLVLTTARQNPENDNVTIKDHETIITALKERSYSKAKDSVRQSAETWYNLMKTE